MYITASICDCLSQTGQYKMSAWPQQIFFSHLYASAVNWPLAFKLSVKIYQAMKHEYIKQNLPGFGENLPSYLLTFNANINSICVPTAISLSFIDGKMKTPKTHVHDQRLKSIVLMI